MHEVVLGHASEQRSAMRLDVWRPNVASFGFAVFLAINASSIWGGVFPFLPHDFQTADILLTFFLVHIASLLATFLAGTVLAYACPAVTRRIRVIPPCLAVAVGSACLIAPLYVPRLSTALMMMGGLLHGIGCASLFLLWQRVFALQTSHEGTRNLLLGTGMSAVVYTALHLVPIAVTAFIIPIVCVPMCGLCLIISRDELDFSAPMIHDDPRDHADVYKHAIRHYWRSALCVGCVGFAAGIVRALAVTDPAVGTTVNIASMAGALASSLVLMYLWQKLSFRFNIVSSFKLIYPFALLGFMLMPFLGKLYLEVFASIAYALFSFATMITVAQCMQASRDNGINPTFIYGFFSCVIYGLQGLGFVIGYIGNPLFGNGKTQLALMALVAVCFLSLALYTISNFSGLRASTNREREQSAERVEFIAARLVAPRPAPAASSEQLDEPAEETAGSSSALEGVQRAQEVRTGGNADEGNVSSEADEADEALGAKEAGTTGRAAATGDTDETVYRDRLAKQCARIAAHYGLSSRETEVMDLILRGFSTPHMAKTLVVSENTIRTHKRHIYAKLDVHKRSELLDLLEYF